MEQEKKQTEYRLTKLELDAQISRVTEDDLKEAFKKARQLLKSGGLSNTKALIERYIHQVKINPESIEVQLNFGFGVSGIRGEKPLRPGCRKRKNRTPGSWHAGHCFRGFCIDFTATSMWWIWCVIR